MVPVPFREEFFCDKNTTGRITGDSFGRLVVRPDSGDPAETCKVCHRVHMPKIEKLWEKILKLILSSFCALKYHFFTVFFKGFFYFVPYRCL